MITICKHCKTPFKTRATKRKYCAHLCYTQSRIGEKRLNLDARGSRNANWKGGRRIDKDGYVLIHTPYHPYADGDGYVREHRLVMERSIKRFLLQHEVVHHENNVKTDNFVENLRLMTKEEHDALPGHFNEYIR